MAKSRTQKRQSEESETKHLKRRFCRYSKGSSGEKNAEKEKHCRFIMVQLPEEVSDKKKDQGYKNICEIGKERIRRAGAKIKADSPLTTQHLDTGFRVLKLDSSNMKDVFYSPKETSQLELFRYVDNVKDDRARKPGSIGACSYPAKVFKGMRMGDGRCYDFPFR